MRLKWETSEYEKTKMLKILATGAALSFMLASSAVAQTRFPCAADIKKVCGSVEPGQGRISACVKEHIKSKDLSAACKARLSKATAVAKVCGDDVKKQCGSEKGRARKAACIAEALTDLSDACQAAIAAIVARKK